MRCLFALAAVAALMVSGPSAAHGEVVAGFRLLQPNPPTVIGTTTITTIPVQRVNGPTVSSAAPVVTEISAAGLTFSTFTASFSSTAPLNLIALDFGFSTLGPTGSYTGTFQADGVDLAIPVPPASGMFSGVGTQGLTIDLAEAGYAGITAGSIEIQLTNATFQGDFTLPTSGFQGFAAVTATVVPEPSMAAGLGFAVLAGSGLLLRRRRASKNSV